jgi:hypothetical protein
MSHLLASWQSMMRAHGKFHFDIEREQPIKQ